MSTDLRGIVSRLPPYRMQVEPHPDYLTPFEHISESCTSTTRCTVDRQRSDVMLLQLYIILLSEASRGTGVLGGR